LTHGEKPEILNRMILS